MPVRIPLDRICVNTGVLCPRCQRIAEERGYSDLDIRVMRALLSLEKRLGATEIEFVSTRRLDGKLLVLVRAQGEVPVWLGRELQAALDDPSVARIIVLPIDIRDPKALIEYAIRPFRVLDIKKVYLPDGSEDLIVKLPRAALERTDPAVLETVLDVVRRRIRGEVYIEYVDVPAGERVSIAKEDLWRVLDKIGRR